MTDIVKYGNQQLGFQKKRSKLTFGSAFEKRIEEAKSEAPVVAEELPNKIVLALDCSGSMAGESIQILRDASDAFVSECLDGSTAVGMQSFPRGTEVPLLDDELSLKLQIYTLKASGETPMYEALTKLPENYKMTRVVLISDGAPTDWQEGETLEELKDSRVLRHYIQNKIPIDCVHADRSSYGEEILKNIAEATGGIFVKFDNMKNLTKGLKYLSPKRRLMLTSGQAQIEGAREVKI